jgi:ParB-like chromosome segregation protein Spo0J
MTADDFAALMSDIKENGLINPIVLFENQILDGKHRYKACLELNIELKLETFTGSDEQALHYVISQNIARRHLLTGQKAALAINAKKEFEAIAAKKQKEAGKLGLEFGKLGGRGITKDSNEYREKKELLELDDIQNNDESDKPLQEIFPEGVYKKDDKKTAGQSRDKAAKLFNVNPHYITDAEKIEKTDKAVFDKVRNGKFNIQEAKHLCKLDEPIRKKAVEKINNGEFKKVKDAIYQARKEDFQDKKDNVEKALNTDNKNIQESELTVETGDIIQIGEHILICGDNTEPAVIEYIKKNHFDFCFADPPYNALDSDYDKGGFIWTQDYLTDIADIVAVTPGTISIQDFMKNTNMPYKWALACFFNNLQAPAAVGYRHWDFTALFSNKSVHKGIKDTINLNIPKMPDEDKEIAKNRQKPAVYLTWLIESFTKENDLILDPFIGSGNIMLTAEVLNRKCVGIEILPDICEGIVKRFKQKYPDVEVKKIDRLE